MKFEEAYNQMLKGKKIKRPCFEGYWFIDGYDGKLKIHLRTDETIETGDLDLTIRNSLAEDWEVYPDPNKTFKFESVESNNYFRKEGK